MLNNIRTTTSWSMRNAASNIAAALSDICSAELLQPVDFFSRRVSGAIRKYAIYFDVYVLTAIHLALLSMRCDLVIAADHTYAVALWSVPRRKRTTFVHDTTGIRHAMGMLDSPVAPGLLGRLYQRAVLGSIQSMPTIGTNTSVSADELDQLGCKGETFVIGQTIFPQRFDDHSASTPSRSDFILHIGSDTWVKNKPYLLRLYREFRTQFGTHAPALWLVGETTPETTELIASLGLSDFVHLEHGVSDERLAEILGGCRALVMPSLYEGFGVPPLEALRFGKPIFLSDIPVFREIYGNAAFYLDLSSPRQAALQLASGLTAPSPDPDLVDDVIGRYSSKKNAERTAEWIRRALTQSHAPRSAPPHLGSLGPTTKIKETSSFENRT